LNKNSIKDVFIEIFFCFATFVVQNLLVPTRERKTEKKSIETALDLKKKTVQRTIQRYDVNTEKGEIVHKQDNIHLPFIQ
jgi:hypothetical protein